MDKKFLAKKAMFVLLAMFVLTIVSCDPTKGGSKTVEKVEKIEVLYNLGDGTQVEGVVLLVDGKIEKPKDPVLQGYSFVGWYKDEEFKEAWDFEKEVSEKRLVFYAKWINTHFSPSICPLIEVPAGQFQLGTSPDNIMVLTEPFYLGKYEITSNEFFDVMGFLPLSKSSLVESDEPIHSINWYHAITFCNKLSIREGLTPAYEVGDIDFATFDVHSIEYNYNNAFTADDFNIWNNTHWNVEANGYRLPTEMEWKWAAMGAYNDEQINAIADNVNVRGWNKAFAGSFGLNSLGDYAWYYDNTPSGGVTKAKKVGLKKPNELGFYDMSGNVHEWCWDWSGPYLEGKVLNFGGSLIGTKRVVCGGSWNDQAKHMPISERNFANPEAFGDIIGFRIARNVD